MLVPAPRRRDVGVPALGHLTPSQLNRALIEGRLQLQQEQRLFDVQDPRHDSFTLAAKTS